EVMASRGVAVTGATGEEYARGFQNAVVIETDDANEIVTAMAYLQEHPEEARRIRAEGHATAAEYTWERVVEIIRRRVQFLVAGQRLAR
ncbi:MAG: glycosyltransferase, partial [Armatimonadota bacterium]|nr:glycosyltransferase [Armatimonadota bacterium]